MVVGTMKLLNNIDRKKVRKMLGKASDVVLWLIVVAASLYLLRWLLVFTTYDVFRTPTGSMTPTIMPGDKGYINKWKLGGRVFDLYAAAEGKPFKVRRLPGYGKLERGDVEMRGEARQILEKSLTLQSK